MKSIVAGFCLLLISTTGFSQKPERNGDIFIKHPYIEIVNKTNMAYLANDTTANRTFYADTARFWASGMTKSVSYPENLKHWTDDFSYYDSVRLVPTGYPDYLAYKDGKIEFEMIYGDFSQMGKN